MEKENNDMKGKICLLAPYKDLLFFNEDEGVDSEYDNLIVKKYGSLKKIIGIANDFQNKGGEIIITRGGTAEILKQKTSLNIVEIEISSYEIIKALQKIKNRENPLGIIGFRKAVYKCSYLAKILGFKETYEVMYEDSQWVDCYKDLENLIYNKKINTFIGDTTFLNLLEKETCYVDFYLIKSEYNSVYKAYQLAKQILHSQKIEEEKNSKFRLILNNIKSGLILTTNSGKIEEINFLALKLLSIKKGKNIFTSLPVLKKLISEEEKEIFIKLDHENILVICSKLVRNNILYYLFTVEREIENIKRTFNVNGNKKIGYTWEDILTQDKNFKQNLELAKAYSKTNESILIVGETGTGKELIAQSIHNESSRKDNLFVAFNCANMIENLIESEFFGYEEGAFTGAIKKGKKGLFELADNGTIFLDEISEIPYHLQGKLLRVLEEKTFRRIGGYRDISVNVRIIAASNKDLLSLIKENKFRKDLYYRLNTLKIETIPLRKRKNDIVFLSNYFLKKLLYDKNYPIKEFDNLIKVLREFYFSGNVRELKNIIKQIIILKTRLNYSDNKILNFLKKDEFKEEIKIDFEGMTLKEIEQTVILNVLNQEKGNKTKTAARLGIDRGKVSRILKNITTKNK